jgi:hypothetical protein
MVKLRESALLLTMRISPLIHLVLDHPTVVGNAYARSPSRNLQACNLHTLVHLDFRADLEMRSGPRRHSLDVLQRNVDIEDQRRRCQFMASLAYRLAIRVAVRFLP